jgi:hypothetical protein
MVETHYLSLAKMNNLADFDGESADGSIASALSQLNKP